LLSVGVILSSSAGCSSAGGNGGSAGAGAGGSAAAGTGATAGTGTGAAAGTGATAGSSGAGGVAGTGGSAGSGASGGTGGAGGSGATGGTGGGTGAEICNNDQDDDADGFYDCNDTDCFADAGCIADDLSLLGMPGFVPCGQSVSFTIADSDATCQQYALGWSPYFDSKCEFASYSGTVSFYCPPKPNTDAVGLRWEVHSNVPTEIIGGKMVLWETLGGENAFGNGGGSAQNPLHKSFDLQSSDMVEDFIGYDQLAVDATTKGTYTNWFALWDLSGAGQAPQVSGGFALQVDAAQLFGTN
jgi:hypothetical protein